MGRSAGRARPSRQRQQRAEAPGQGRVSHSGPQSGWDAARGAGARGDRPLRPPCVRGAASRTWAPSRAGRRPARLSGRLRVARRLGQASRTLCRSPLVTTHRRVCRLPHGLSCASSGRVPRWSGLRGGQVLGRKPRGRAPAPTRRPSGRGRRVTCRRLATGSPRRRGTPCCSTTAASTRSTTSSPWRSWTSRCSSPSRQVGPLAGRAAPWQALGRLKAPRPHAAPSGVLTARPHVPVREPGLWADPGRAKVRVACGNPAGRLRGRGRGLAAARRTGGLGAHGPAVGEGRAPTRRGARGPRPLTSAFSPHLPPPTGETTTAVAPQVPGGVSDGRWHSVRVQYYNKVGGCGPRGPWAARGGRRALLRPEPFML